MSDLKVFDKSTVEKFLGMEGGVVSNFSNLSFGEFVRESIGVDPYDPAYDIEGRTSSKANRLRGIFKVESNFKVGKLLQDLAQHHYRTDQITEKQNSLYNDVMVIGKQLQGEKIVESLDAIKEKIEDMDFSTLAKTIRDSIEKNEPQAALDRLHTYMFTYFRKLCDKHRITYTQDDPLHSVYGKYIKFLVENKHIESEMTQLILKSANSHLSAYNNVRNNQSFAHPNKTLNYDESLLIANNLLNSLKFIQSIEIKITKKKEPPKFDPNDLPY